MDQINCLRCRGEIDAEDHFCRHCGLQLRPKSGGEFAQVQIVPETKSASLKFSDNPWFVLAMLFLGVGPFALPMLWQGRAFSLRWKWILSVLVILYVVLICWLLWYILVKMLIEPLQKLQF